MTADDFLRENTMKIYISGPMTGLEAYNRPAFHQAEKELEALGHTVLNPARITEPDLDLNREPRWDDWMRAAIRLLMNADAVALLPGWSRSRGAVKEVELAETLGIPTATFDWWSTDEARAMEDKP